MMNNFQSSSSLSLKSKTEESPAPRKIRMGVNVGSSSILLIFVILCLVSFATLSLVSANADSRLSRKILNRTTDYYNACNIAEARIAQLDRQLAEAYEASSSAAEYSEKTGGLECSFTVKISDTQILQVSLEPVYPVSDEQGFYQITCWKVVNTEEYDYDSTLPVFR